MSEIFITYASQKGFARCSDKAGLGSSPMSYEDFKNKAGEIKAADTTTYGFIMSKDDIPDFIENFEVDSIFAGL